MSYPVLQPRSLRVLEQTTTLTPLYNVVSTMGSMWSVRIAPPERGIIAVVPLIGQVGIYANLSFPCKVLRNAITA